MHQPRLNYLQCPKCKSYGVLRARKTWMETLIPFSSIYKCQECGSRFREHRANSQKPGGASR